MSSQSDIPNVCSNTNGDIFACAQLNPAKFHAKVLALGDMNFQQAEDGKLTLEKDASTMQPINVKELLRRVDGDEDLDKLGKNLLDSFALIFAQPGPEGVIATVMERKNPNSYVLYVAKNYGIYDHLTRLANDIKSWFRMRGPYPVKAGNVQSHIDNPTFENSYWRQILWDCYPSIRKSQAPVLVLQ
ncbi:hypothetical protein F4806DRAFT_448684 [Annulohypoxylon nitens]|nr:hypothetical protein F4806DRAFT_448684 [Annulohypoxylon nitens]